MCMCVGTNPMLLSKTCREDLGNILQEHKESIVSSDKEATRRITVRRSHLFDDTIKMLKTRPWNPLHHFKVTFLGEPGIDDGGPRREFFRLLLAEIGRKNSLFHGESDRRVPVHNVLALGEKIFFHIGQILGLSLINDGPGLQCLAPTVANYLLGKVNCTPELEDIPNHKLREQIQKVIYFIYIMHA